MVKNKPVKEPKLESCKSQELRDRNDPRPEARIRNDAGVRSWGIGSETRS